MRIIAGIFKGRNLKKFEISSTRPTSDLIRGAVFNSIGTFINDSTFLDLFAGTGAMGIEAISRGAKKVYFIDQNKQCTNLIKENLKSLQIQNYQLVKCDYLSALCDFNKNEIKFNVIYIDPPYMSNYAEKAIIKIKELNLLTSDGQVFWEHDASKLPLIKNAGLINTKKYGSKYVTKLNIQNLEPLVKCINIQNIK